MQYCGLVPSHPVRLLVQRLASLLSGIALGICLRLESVCLGVSRLVLTLLRVVGPFAQSLGRATSEHTATVRVARGCVGLFSRLLLKAVASREKH